MNEVRRVGCDELASIEAGYSLTEFIQDVRDVYQTLRDWVSTLGTMG